MMPLIGRLFLFLLLVADYVGDPHFGQSPLSRPYASQDAFCHSVVQRVVLLKATTSTGTMPGLHLAAHALRGLDTHLPMRGIVANLIFLAAADPLYGLMSLQC
jgi:hypothetical protein